MDEDRRTDETARARILAVVVMYKTPLADSMTIQGLLQAFACHPDLRNSVDVLIWDNSPTPLHHSQSFSSFTYRHSQENLGVSGAYNRAMKLAESMGCQWLLLLDQDTTIPADFLQHILRLGSRFLDERDIAAVVPFLMAGDRVVSPREVLFKRLKPLRRPFQGIYPGEVSAANSGTFIRLDALKQIGGFNEDFWLDFSDVVVFHLLHRQGKKVYIAGDLLLQHHISVLDFETSMSPKRYLNFLAAEGAYWDIYRSVTARGFHTLRILERAIRQKRRLGSSEHARVTLTYFLRRLFLSKRQRLKWWKLQSLQRDMPS